MEVLLILYTLGVSCLCALVLTPAARSVARYYSIVDRPDALRKHHKKPTPYLGGVAIVAAFVIAIIFLSFTLSPANDLYQVRGAIALACLMVIALTGLYDDVRGLSFKIKFAIQILISLVLIFAGFRIDFGIVQLLPLSDIAITFISGLITLLWYVGIMNAVNLIDGKDGLAAGVSAIALLGMSISFGWPNDIVMIAIGATLVGALFGFLVFNFNPASIFMGDTGSLFLGLALAVFAVEGSLQATSSTLLLVPILTLGFPILDTSLSIFRRFVHKVGLFSPDSDHIHHRLQAAFSGSQKKTVLTLYAYSSLLSLNAVLIAVNWNVGRWVLIISGVVTILLMRRLGYIHLRATFKTFLQSWGFLPSDPYITNPAQTQKNISSIQPLPIGNSGKITGLVFASSTSDVIIDTYNLSEWPGQNLRAVVAIPEDVASDQNTTSRAVKGALEIISYNARAIQKIALGEESTLSTRRRFLDSQDLFKRLHDLDVKPDFLLVDLSDRTILYVASIVSWLWSRPLIVDLQPGWKANLNKKTRLALRKAHACLVHSSADVSTLAETISADLKVHLVADHVFPRDLVSSENHDHEELPLMLA